MKGRHVIALVGILAVAALAAVPAGAAARGGGVKGKRWLQATATFSVGPGMTVSIRGGGGGTSNCTTSETDTRFVTQDDNEPHHFGFDSKVSGSCAVERSWSFFKVTVTDVAGETVGVGDMWLGQDALYGPYGATCGPHDSFAGVKCEVTGYMTVKIHGPARSPAGKRKLGDHVVAAGATFSIGDGYKVDIIGGGGGTSDCTTDETTVSFTTTSDSERELYQEVAKNGGSCWYTLSWSNFRVEVRDPREGGRVIGTGIMWLGQLDPVIGYRASCESGEPKWSSQTGPGPRPYVWDRLKCTETSAYEVTITRT